MPRLTHRVASLTVVGVLSAAALTGCGGSSSSSTASSAEPSGIASGQPDGFRLSSAQQRKIQKCLKAAGLSTSFPTGRPSDFPSGGPSGSPPSGAPTSIPSGGFSGGSGGPGGGFADPEVQSALKACGITVPSRPTGAPSSG
jgi:hypothetical protein